MKPHVLYTALLLTLALPTKVHSQKVVVPSARVKNSVSIRKAASATSQFIGRLKVGESATLIQNVPRWRHVRLSDGRFGFVSKSWTDVIDPVTTLAARKQNELRIHFLNTGSGTCAVVECPGAAGPPMIVDCGSSKQTSTEMTKDQARDYIAAVLLAHTEKPNVVLSHGDKDHYNLIPHVLGSKKLGHVWQGGQTNTYGLAGFPAWLTARVADGAVVHGASELTSNWHNNGDPLGLTLSCGTASVYVLTVNSGSSKNANSLVLGIDYNEFFVIFTGDAEGVTETKARTHQSSNIKATVLVGSHHGANTKGSNGSKWFNATAPEIVVYTAGDQYGHPRCLAMDRLRPSATAHHHPVRCGTSNTNYQNRSSTAAEYVTHTNGTIVITTDGQTAPSVHCSLSTGCGLR